MDSSARARERARRGGPSTGPPRFPSRWCVLLAVLVLLPLFWLLVTSLRDSAKAFTLEHYRHLFVDPAFVQAAGDHAVDLGRGRRDLRGHRRADGVARRAHRSARQALLRMLILASFVTPPFLGAFAWVLLGGPNAGLINQWYYALLGLKPFEAHVAHQHLLRVGHGVRHGALHVSVRVHVRREQPRHDSERARGGLCDPRRPGLAYGCRTSPCRWSCRRCLPGSWSRFCSR